MYKIANNSKLIELGLKKEAVDDMVEPNIRLIQEKVRKHGKFILVQSHLEFSLLFYNQEEALFCEVVDGEAYVHLGFGIKSISESLKL